ncbi:MAG: hypothetical protein H7Y38_15115 [Armatimonadetes bacterium]|nr:hypothetical protein [Armatimonadota bacterium]
MKTHRSVLFCSRRVESGTIAGARGAATRIGSAPPPAFPALSCDLFSPSHNRRAKLT